MKKAYRISFEKIMDNSHFEEHLNFVKQNINLIDEISLFTEYAHCGYWDLERRKQIAEILKDRIVRYRKVGVKSVGINPLCTIGHLDEAWDIMPKPPMQTLIGLDGKMSRTCLCPNTKEFKEYITEAYKIHASVGADFIWLDDDIRIKFHNGIDGCMCPVCIDKFNKKYGRNETYESISAALKSGNKEFSDLWFEDYWAQNYTELMGLIKNAIRSVNSNVEIGLMSAGHIIYPEWFEALEAVKGRPGGGGDGFNNDSRPRAMFEKYFCCEAQTEKYPQKVTDIQYEVESFSYHDYIKSDTIASMELDFAVMTGANGIAFNVMGYYDNRHYMDMLSKKIDFLNEVNARAVKMKNYGIYATTLDYANAFLDIGLPISSDRENACAVILNKEYASTLSDEELIKILSGSVFVDASGLEQLTLRGLNEYCGVAIDKTCQSSVKERFCNHSINGEYSGYIRNAQINFYYFLQGKTDYKVYTLKKLSESTEFISELITIHGDYYGACGSVYENSLGGRVAVSTYAPELNVQYTAKQMQYFNLFDWLCKDKYPIRNTADYRVVPVIRKNGEDYILMLVNNSFDRTGEFFVEIRNVENSCKLINKNGALTDYPYEALTDGIRVKIDSLEPWSSVMLTNK